MGRTRRSLLRAGGLGFAVGLAGCSDRLGTATDGTRESDDAAETTASPTAAASAGTTEEQRLRPGPLPAGALWVPPVRDPASYLPGRFVRQVSARAVTDHEARLHPEVFDSFSQELWDRPARLFGVDADAIDAKYQVPGQGVRILAGSFDPGRVAEYLGRPFERVGERDDLTLHARPLERGERLVAVGEEFLVAGFRDDAESAIEARYGAPEPLSLVDGHFWEAAVDVADADVLSVTDRHNRTRSGLLGDVAARGIAWTFEGDRTRLRAPFVFFRETMADPAVVREWADRFEGLESYEHVSLSQRGRRVSIDATTRTDVYDGGVSGRPGE